MLDGCNEMFYGRMNCFIGVFSLLIGYYLSCNVLRSIHFPFSYVVCLNGIFLQERTLSDVSSKGILVCLFNNNRNFSWIQNIRDTLSTWTTSNKTKHLILSFFVSVDTTQTKYYVFLSKWYIIICYIFTILLIKTVLIPYDNIYKCILCDLLDSVNFTL